jgi:hypothetical protein
VSLGVLTVTSAGPGGSRVGLLPPWPVALVAVVAAWSVIVPLARRGIPSWPLALLALTIVPWLPLPLAGGLLVWAGPLTAWVWIAAAAAWLHAALAGRLSRGRIAAWLAAPSRASVLAFVVASSVFGAAAWQLQEMRPGGDEPHYLVIVQSLLGDGDLRIENNHEARDYSQYFGGLLRPHFLKRGADGEIYSIHAPGLPVVVAPAFAVGGYSGVVLLLVVLSALGTVVVWRTGWLLTGSAGAAWFGWATACGAPFFFHSYAVYPDALGATLVATGVLALVRLDSGRNISLGRLGLHGAALAALPWLHTRYAVAAGVLGACIALRLVTRARPADASPWRARLRPPFAFLAVPAVSAAAWFGFFHAIWGTFNPAAPYGDYTQTAPSNILRGLPGLLLDQQFGILPNAPVYACAFIGIAWLARRRLRLALELSLLVAGYLAAVSAYHMWWGGWSAPARFAVPALLALGVAASFYWAEARTAGRGMGAALLGLTLLVTGTMTLARGGRLIVNTRDGFARLLDFLAPNVDLPRALPSFFRDGRPLAFAQAAVWIAAFAGAAVLLRAIANRQGGRPGPPGSSRLSVLVPLVAVAAIVSAASVSWLLGGFSPVSPLPGQLALLQRYDPAALPFGLRFEGARPVLGAADSVPPRLRLGGREGRPSPPEDVLLALGALPAGTYRADPASLPAARGSAVIRLGRAEGAMAEWTFAPVEGPPDLRFDLPAGASAVTIEGDEAACRSVRDLWLQPVAIVPPSERAYGVPARRTARFGRTVVYSFDDRAYLESPGLWVRGGVAVPLVLSHPALPRVRVKLRNGPVPNTVAIEGGGGWRADLDLAPGEERTIDVPQRGSLLPAALLRVRTERGFRPSETTPGNRDERYLGVWLEFPGDQD